MQVESKLKAIEDEKAAADDANAKLSHVKKNLEELVDEISENLTKEEEKAKQLATTKSKQEEQINKGKGLFNVF